MAAPKKKGLGRGLESLFGEVGITPDKESNEILMTVEKTSSKKKKTAASSKETAADTVDVENTIQYLDINDIKPNPDQPRKVFNEEKISELADSIKEHGIIQPLVVRKAEIGYEIVAGERRYRAARKAELKQVPCIVRELTDEQNMFLAIIENMQREDLNPIEEAEAIHKLIETYGLTQEQVSKSVGKSRPYVTNSLRLLKLPEEIKEMVAIGQLSQGHARALINVADNKQQMNLAIRARDGGLSVRAMEQLAGKATTGKKGKPAKRKPKSTDQAVVEEDLKKILGTKVNLNQKGTKGKIEIEYYSRDELERLIELLKSLA